MTYLIAEIGQNHNGSIDLAKLLIDIVARPITDKFISSVFRDKVWPELELEYHTC